MRFSCSTQNQANDSVASSSCPSEENVECTKKCFEKRHLKCDLLHLFSGGELEKFLLIMNESLLLI